MINFDKVNVGDQLRIVGMGAPGFAKLGDIVTVINVAKNRVDVKREDGEQAFFALTCGAQRLEPYHLEPVMIDANKTYAQGHADALREAAGAIEALKP